MYYYELNLRLKWSRKKMLSFSKKLSLCIATLFVFTSVFGQNQYKQKTYDQGHIVDENQMMGGYNSPARIDVTGSWDVFTTASYIYWEASEKGLELGYTAPTAADINNNHVTGQVADMNFKYGSGFKVGLGMNFEHDNWNIYTDYTRYHKTFYTNIKKSQDWDETGSFFSSWWYGIASDGTHSINANSSWKLKYDMIDFELGRPFYNGRMLTVKPHFGARGGWIRQGYKGDLYYVYTNPYGLIPMAAHSNSWVIGPRAGFNTNWIFGSGFRFFGDFAGSILYQKFSVRYHCNNITSPHLIAQNQKDQFSRISPNCNLNAGFGWGTYFAKKSWHFDLTASYEFEYYWNQNRMRTIADSINEPGALSTSIGDLMLHGLTVNMKFDF